MEEQIKIVKHYMNNIDNYRKIQGSYWDILKQTDLKNKNNKFITQIDELINEWIDNGKIAFYKKYN
jgi:hypothetical protein